MEQHDPNRFNNQENSDTHSQSQDSASNQTKHQLPSAEHEAKHTQNKNAETDTQKKMHIHNTPQHKTDSIPDQTPKKKGFSLSALALHIFEHKYEKLLIFSITLLFLSIGYIGYSYGTTGNFIETDVSLKGGVTLTVFNAPDADIDTVRNTILEAAPKSDVVVRSLTERGIQRGVIIDSGDIAAEELAAIVEASLGVSKEEYTIEMIGSALGQSFFKQAIKAVILAFIFMAITVFIIFRSAVPSFYVVLAALSDIIETWAILLLLGIKLSTAGIAALLMLIGYSVDTDILLTTRVLRRSEESVFKSVLGALKTGMTMTLASFAAVCIAYFYSSSDTLKQIMLILAIGLIFDVINTWFQNASLLRKWIEKKKIRPKFE